MGPPGVRPIFFQAPQGIVSENPAPQAAARSTSRTSAGTASRASAIRRPPYTASARRPAAFYPLRAPEPLPGPRGLFPVPAEGLPYRLQPSICAGGSPASKAMLPPPAGRKYSGCCGTQARTAGLLYAGHITPLFRNAAAQRLRPREAGPSPSANRRPACRIGPRRPVRSPRSRRRRPFRSPISPRPQLSGPPCSSPGAYLEFTTGARRHRDGEGERKNFKLHGAIGINGCSGRTGLPSPLCASVSLWSRISRNRADQVGRRMVLWIAHDRDGAAVRPDYAAFRDGVCCVIGAFGVEVRADGFDKVFDRRLVKDGYGINSSERRHDLGPFGLGHERAALSF